MPEVVQTDWPEVAEIEVEERFTIRGKGFVMLTMRAPFETPRDGSGLVGRTFELDGKVVKVVGVDRYAMALPMIREGEQMALAVQAVTAS